jgi:hypothetical protein
MQDRRLVMVVYGRNADARNAMFSFLRALGLTPLEWEQAVDKVGTGSPYNLDAVKEAMSSAQAVVVLLTAEDRAGLLPQLADSGEDTALRGQPRQNVTLEAGMAMGLDAKKTILVELGPIRLASDFAGLNVIRMDNRPQTRQALKSRLEGAGCEIAQSAVDWMDASSGGGDFDAAIVDLGDDALADPVPGSAVLAPPPKAPAPPPVAAEPTPAAESAVASDDSQYGSDDRALVDAFLNERVDAGAPFAARDLYRAAGLTPGRGARMLSELRDSGRIALARDGRSWIAKAP